ncbi:MAG: ABC transporter substrate-binding protein [Candidatus Caldarchaeum sp.]|nr:ABC transporter substrate-binding protein [Candidatus Caldarchaeum sp.]
MSSKPTPKTLAATTTLFLIIGLVGGFYISQAAFPATLVRTTTLLQTTTVLQTVEVREKGPEHAKLFGLEKRDGYVLLRDGINRTVLLVPRGAALPNVKADLVVRTPVERVVLMSTTHVALVERLREYAPEMLDRVVGFTWGGGFKLYFPEFEKRLADGRIKDVGAAFSPDYEKIIALNPDLVMIYTYPGDPVISKLAELKLPYVVNGEYLETEALGRFEWIKFVAAFFQLDAEAQKVLDYVKTSYVLTSSKAKTLLDRGIESRKKIAWFSVFRGTVYAAAGESYVAKALRELGADYVFSDLKGTGSGTVSKEELAARTVDADVIVVSTDLITSLESLLKEVPELSRSKAVREGRVYRYNSNIFQLGYYDTEGWFADIASLLYPKSFDDTDLKYFVQLR